MLLTFFRGGSGDAGLEHVTHRAVAMINDARHSFDLASLALLTEAGPDTVSHDVRETDQRINQAEQSLRSELIVHVSVHGSADIGTVLGLTLLLKKIERIGDQAKNILELAELGASLAAADDVEQLLHERHVVSTLFADAAELLADAGLDEAAVDAFADRADPLTTSFRERIESCVVSDRPGREVVPVAIYHRYLLRIVANLLGAVRTAIEPVPQIDYLDGGSVDTDD